MLQRRFLQTSLLLLLLIAFFSINMTLPAFAETPGAALKYDMSGVTGGTMPDQSGNGQDGTITGATNHEINGHYYESFTAANSNRVALPNSSALFGAATTYEIGINFTSPLAPTQRYFGNSYSLARSVFLTTDSSSVLSWQWYYHTAGGYGNQIYAFTSVPTNQRCFLTMVKHADGSASYYMNGQLLQNKASPAGFVSSVTEQSQMYIGSDTLQYSGGFDCDILKIYTTDLNQTQILDDYHDYIAYEYPQVQFNQTTFTGDEGTDITLTLTSTSVNFSVRPQLNCINGTAIKGTDYNLSTGTHVLIGDSITSGINTTHNGKTGIAGYMEERMSGHTFINNGHGGWTTSIMINNFTQDTYNTFADDAMIMSGHNDILQGATDIEVEANLTTYYNQCLKYNMTPVPVTIPASTAFSEPRNVYRESVNTWIRSTATANGWYCVDLDQILGHDPENSRALPAEYTTDGEHLTTLAYEVWANNVSINRLSKNSVVFTPGETSKTFTVHLLNNYQTNDNTEFHISIVNPLNGQIGTDSTITVTINDNGIIPPVANFTADRFSGIKPLTVNFTDLSEGTIDTYAWNFGDDSDNVTTQNCSHIFVNNGTYAVILTVSNDGGNSSIERTITVNNPAIPVSNFNATALNSINNRTITFTDLSTGVIDSRSWDFGDGVTSTEQNPTHTYDHGDNYQVSLTVSNDGGSNTMTQTIPVYGDMARWDLLGDQTKSIVYLLLIIPIALVGYFIIRLFGNEDVDGNTLIMVAVFALVIIIVIGILLAVLGALSHVA